MRPWFEKLLRTAFPYWVLDLIQSYLGYFTQLIAANNPDIKSLLYILHRNLIFHIQIYKDAFLFSVYSEIKGEENLTFGVNAF